MVENQSNKVRDLQLTLLDPVPYKSNFQFHYSQAYCQSVTGTNSSVIIMQKSSSKLLTFSVSSQQ